MPQRPNIRKELLWEYDYDAFHFDRSYKIVIERVLERGNLNEWREIYAYYGKEKILETIDWSVQLCDRDKKFSQFFVDSDLLYP